MRDYTEYNCISASATKSLLVSHVPAVYIFNTGTCRSNATLSNTYHFGTPPLL